MSRLLSSRSVLVTVVLAACQAAVVANAQTPGAPAAAARQVITSAEQLPRRVIKLDKLPSQYLEAPRAEVLALAAVLEKNKLNHAPVGEAVQPEGSNDGAFFHVQFQFQFLQHV